MRRLTRALIRGTFSPSPRRKGFLANLLATLFPRICPLCRSRVLGREEAFCASCLAGFRLLEPPFCNRCGEPCPLQADPAPVLCGRCLEDAHGLTPDRYAVRSAAAYGGELRTAILRLKYGGETWMAPHLGMFLVQAYERLFPNEAFDRIVPVPLHPRRLRERGFNQCILLSRPLASALKIPLDCRSVTRIRHTPAQSASGFAERWRNLVQAFAIHRPSPIKDRAVLVVDDVYTTGATLEALSSVLLRAGARRVGAVTIGRSPLIA
jgi:ComF family protein